LPEERNAFATEAAKVENAVFSVPRDIAVFSFRFEIHPVRHVSASHYRLHHL
jgi:hypothetical protein